MTAQAPTNENIEHIRLFVREKLAAAEAQSIRDGKPLTILVGEAHDSKQSMLLEAIIYDEARKLKQRPVRTVGIEQPYKSEAYLKEAGWWDHYAPSGMHMIDAASRFFDGRQSVQYIDALPQVFGGKRSAQERESRTRSHDMASRLLRITAPSLSVVGAAHLDDMVTDLRNRRTVVAFDTWQDARSPKTIHLHLTGDARELGIRDILKIGFGREADGKFIAHLNGGVEVAGAQIVVEGKIVETTKFLREMEAAVKKDPLDYNSRWQYSEGLFRTRRDAQAGHEAAKAEFVCKVMKPEQQQACEFDGQSGDQHSEAFRTERVIEYRQLTHEWNRWLDGIKQAYDPEQSRQPVREIDERLQRAYEEDQQDRKLEDMLDDPYVPLPTPRGKPAAQTTGAPSRN